MTVTANQRSGDSDSETPKACRKMIYVSLILSCVYWLPGQDLADYAGSQCSGSPTPKSLETGLITHIKQGYNYYLSTQVYAKANTRYSVRSTWFASSDLAASVYQLFSVFTALILYLRRTNTTIQLRMLSTICQRIYCA